jgi:N-acyl-D-amino-acid deacylase
VGRSARGVVRTANVAPPDPGPIDMPLSARTGTLVAVAVHDLVLRGGTIHDGSGNQPWIGDVAITGDTIVALGERLPDRGAHEIDVGGLIVAPGFINMMSWAPETLIEDGRSMSDLLQGITLEVMGEGTSMGPLNESMRQAMQAGGIADVVGGYRYPVTWRTLAEFLTWLERRGVAPNVASFVGAGTLRVHEVGFEDRPATQDELAAMCALLEHEMIHGALGVASALIYPPETSYGTDELVALATVAGAHGGMYASHIRSEGSGLLEAVTELIDIARRAQVRAEVYHFKAAGRTNWPKLPDAIDLIEAARAEGMAVTADAYPYDCAGTSLTACFPPWAHEGGPSALRARLADPSTRDLIRADLRGGGWENPFLDAGPENITISGPLEADLAEWAGCTLADLARRHGRDPADIAMDLALRNRGDVFALYFDMHRDDVRLVARQPWVSFCSDAESLASEVAEQRGGIHPRAFGAFARVLARFARDEQLFPLSEAIHRMTSLPAANLGLRRRGRLRVGHYADIVAFDLASMADHATPQDPHRYATGMVHVLVNGTLVLRDGSHTGARPGRFVRGPGSPVA